MVFKQFTLGLACSKRSDSGERCEVKIAMKSRWGLRSFFLRTAPHYLNAWNRLLWDRVYKLANLGQK